MAEPQWVVYVGMATGIVGTITGVAGAVMGYVGYRRSNTLKSLELRLESRKALNILHGNLSELKKLMERTEQSRKAALAARGMFGSGAMDAWKRELEADENEATQLLQDVPRADEDFRKLSVQGLESTLVEVHRLRGRVSELRKKYEAALQEDDEERKHRRDAAEAKFSQIVDPRG